MLENARDNLRFFTCYRVDEITVDVDKTPYAYYFQQAENGVYCTAYETLLALATATKHCRRDIMSKETQLKVEAIKNGTIYRPYPSQHQDQGAQTVRHA